MDWVNVECTQHNFRCLLNCISGHMVHSSSVRRWLLIAILPLRGLLILLIWAIERHMSLSATTEASSCSVGSTILCRGSIGIPWARCLLTTLLLEGRILLKMLALATLLHLILRVQRVLSMIPPTNWSLEPLLKALLCIRVLTCIAPRALSLYPPFSILLLAHIV
jgi:hypothetical protein